MQEIEAKRKLKASEGAHFFYTLIFLVSTGLIESSYNTEKCNVDYPLIVSLLFYGLTIWATYILITILPKYKNIAIKYFFNFMDICFGLYIFGLYIYALILYYEENNNCAVKAPIYSFFISMFLIVNSVVFVILFLALLSFLLRKWSKSNKDWEENAE